jgi:hypothetical protein
MRRTHLLDVLVAILLVAGLPVCRESAKSLS